MAIAFQCPHCQKAYKVKDELAGKKAECKQCKRVMTVPQSTPAAALVDSHALEALATAALGDAAKPVEAAAPPDAPIRWECEYCFEQVEVSADKAGKKQPCPSCRRIVTVPAAGAKQPKKDWRAIEHNLTMALKNTEAAPENAWGNQQKAVVSREALLEAEVIVDRKKLAAPDRSKLFLTLAVVALICTGMGWFWMRGKAADDRRLSLIADAVKGIDAKSSPAAAGAVSIAAGEFYLRESPPNLKLAVKSFRAARNAAVAVEAPEDRANLLRSLVAAQAALMGDEAKIEAGQALPWEESLKELRQTLQTFKQLPREDGWLALEELTSHASQLADKTVLLKLAPNALPQEADRADAIACVALTLMRLDDPQATAVADQAGAAFQVGGDAAPPVRLVALLVATGKLDHAKQIMPDVPGDEPPLDYRLAYTEGYARSGDPANLEKAKKLAAANGPIEHKVAAWCVLADATGQPADLDAAAQFTAEQGQKFTLPNWPVEKLASACRRAQRPGLIGQMAMNIKQPSLAPWLELAVFEADLDQSTSTADAGPVQKISAKSAAQALAWIALGRHNARYGGDARSIASWPNESDKLMGFAGAALGLQDRAK